MSKRPRQIIVTILFTLFGGPGLVLVLVPWLITRFRIPAGEPRWQMLVAVLLIAAGLIPLLESIVRFITEGHGTLVPIMPPERLVVSGLYRYVRNPMYTGVMTVMVGEALLFEGYSMVIDLIAVCVAMNLFVHLHEEPKLTRSFPADYPIYMRNVRRWLPRLTPWNGNGAEHPH